MGSYSNVLFLLMDNLVIIVEHFLLFLFADMFLYRRWRGIPALLPALALGWFLQHRLDTLDVGLLKILLSLAIDAACLLLYYTGNRYPDKLLKKAFLLASYYTFMGITQAAAISALYSIFGDGDVLNLHAYPVLAWGAYINSLLLMLLCLLFCERFRKVETVPLTVRSWLVLLCVPVVSIAFVWLLFPFGRHSADEPTLLLVGGLSTLLLGINLFAFFLYRGIAKSTAALCRHEDLKRYCRHLDNLIQSESKSRDVIHDYLHNLGAIAALIERGDTRGAADYIYRLESRIKAIRAERHTGNKEVDAILACKLPQMRESGFSCKVEGTLPATLPFDFLDVCALLSNALDNAAEACALQGCRGEVITLEVAYRDGFFKFRLRNPLGDRSGRAGHQPGRGRGLPIMREVAKKYQGGLWVSFEEGDFLLTGLLQGKCDRV